MRPDCSSRCWLRRSNKLTTTSAATRVSEIVGVPSTTFGWSLAVACGLRQEAAKTAMTRLPADKHPTKIISPLLV